MFEKGFYKLSWANKMHAFIIIDIMLHLLAATRERKRERECVCRDFLPLTCSPLHVNNEPSEIVRKSTAHIQNNC